MMEEAGTPLSGGCRRVLQCEGAVNPPPPPPLLVNHVGLFW